MRFLTFQMVLWLLLPMLSGCSGTETYRTVDGSVWHTSFHIIYGCDDGRTPDLDDSIVAVMRRVELSLSAFEPLSTVSAVNANATEAVDEMFAEVFNASQRVSVLSGGMFDPTVGPLVDAWGFGRKGAVTVAPDSSAVDSLLRLVGIADCAIDGLRLTKKSAATTFDFSAIAKGYGCDCVGRMFERNGVENYMVEIGGEIALAGKSQRHTDWRIQIDRPVATEADSAAVHSRMAVVELTDCGVATSGNYRNFRRMADSTVVSHTISPVTGRPVRTTTVSATVIAPDCMTADALATAAMAMPLDEARNMFGQLDDVSAMLVTDTGDTLAVTYYGNFPVQ